MRRIILIVVLLITNIACVILPEQTSFEEKASTQVAVALTATALDATISVLDSSVEDMTVTPQHATKPTQKPPADPKSDLDQPTYKDDSSSWSAWSVDTGDQVLESVTTISITDGKLSMESSQTGKFHWWLNYREFDNGYLEAKFETGNCSGADQYGLVFRAPDYFNGVGYYLTLTCDGKLDLREKDDPNSRINNDQFRLGMITPEHINAGANHENTIGIWMQDKTIRIYINDHFVDEITDAKITAAGHFGPFIYARNTAGFKIYLDEVSYWLFDD